MHNIVEKAQRNGVSGEYWEREDGCKMYGDFIICAANFETFPYGTIVNTSRGLGIILDTGDFAKTEPRTIDLAVNW